MRVVLLGLAVLAVPAGVAAQQHGQNPKLHSAMMAAPMSVSKDATIKDWDGTVLKQGTSAWVCYPDMPDTPGNDPMCLDGPWQEWLDAYINKKPLRIDKMGLGYMLTGDNPASNTDPYATGPTADNEWMAEGVPHLMIIVPDSAMLRGLPTDPKSGGPWVMWRNTPYAHIMVPMPKHQMMDEHGK